VAFDVVRIACEELWGYGQHLPTCVIEEVLRLRIRDKVSNRKFHEITGILTSELLQHCIDEATPTTEMQETKAAVQLRMIDHVFRVAAAKCKCRSATHPCSSKQFIHSSLALSAGVVKAVVV
jgi:hypothetical protein